MKKVSLLLSFVLSSVFVFAQTGSVLIQPSNDEVLATKYSGSEPNLAGRYARGTSSAPTAVLSGNELVSFSARGYTGSAFSSDKARITMLADENFSPSANGTRIAFFTTTNGTTSLSERMRIDNRGFVGIGSATPDFPLHVQSTSLVSNSSNGAFAIGSTTGAHLNFDGNDINAWSNTTGATLYLNYYSNAKVQVGSGSTGNLDVNGFSNLGDGAPAIKMKKLTGTTSSAATGSVLIPHGLTGTKILSIDVLVEYSSGDYVPPSYTVGSGYEYTYYLSGSSIGVTNISGSGILSKPIKIVVTYEQ